MPGDPSHRGDSSDCDDTAEVVREMLAAYRAELYRGRGPGISGEEWLSNTSLRPAVAGVPTALAREELHLRTLRARGEETAAEAEEAWAAAQYASPGAPGDDGTD